MIKKIFAGGLLFIVLLIGGCLFTLRGCLSKYDERFALPPVLYFEKNGQTIAVSLVKFSKTTSYTSKGGFTSKSFDHSYYIQKNNAVTGEKLLSEEIDVPGRLKHYPEEVLGAAANRAWIFLDELMAFDAETLQKVADKKIIEEKNPALKGSLPEEQRYYQFNNIDNTIEFTAKDGAKWVLNTATLMATLKEENDKEAIDDKLNEGMRKLKRMQEKNISFNEMIINQDTVNAQWWGMYSTSEIKKLNESVSLGTVYTQNSRRQFFTGRYSSPRENSFIINKENLNNINATAYFLDGGFLLNKQTAKPIWLINPDSRLVIYKNEIGHEAKLMLCRITTDGKIQWQLNTGLRNWVDWYYKDDYLFITGNNKSSDNNRCSILLSINLQTGIATTHNYFSDDNK